MTTTVVLNWLRPIPLFAACSDEQLELIMARATERYVPTGTVLCEQDREGGDFFVILTGRVSVHRDGRLVATLSEGDFFGEIALVDRGKRTATVIAETPLRCLALGPDDFRRLLRANPDIAIQVLEAVAQRMRGLLAGYSSAL